MQTLPLQRTFYQQQMTCRFLRELNPTQKLILTIPGGPCLSGKYLDPFLMQLAAHTKINVGIMDLPNHDDSKLSNHYLPLTYQTCLSLIQNALLEIKNEANEIILFGQSFGARIVFDLCVKNEIPIKSAFLTGLPYQFSISNKLQKKIAALDLSESNSNNPEQIFADTWEKILPLYTYHPLDNAVFKSLTENARVKGNHAILDTAPTIGESINSCVNHSFLPSMMIVQGENDEVVPDDNMEQLQKMIPEAYRVFIPQCGHFVMIEQPEATLHAFSQLIMHG